MSKSNNFPSDETPQQIDFKEPGISMVSSGSLPPFDTSVPVPPDNWLSAAAQKAGIELPNTQVNTTHGRHLREPAPKQGKVDTSNRNPGGVDELRTNWRAREIHSYKDSDRIAPLDKIFVGR